MSKPWTREIRRARANERRKKAEQVQKDKGKLQWAYCQGTIKHETIAGGGAMADSSPTTECAVVLSGTRERWLVLVPQDESLVCDTCRIEIPAKKHPVRIVDTAELAALRAKVKAQTPGPEIKL